MADQANANLDKCIKLLDHLSDACCAASQHRQILLDITSLGSTKLKSRDDAEDLLSSRVPDQSTPLTVPVTLPPKAASPSLSPRQAAASSAPPAVSNQQQQQQGASASPSTQTQSVPPPQTLPPQLTPSTATQQLPTASAGPYAVAATNQPQSLLMPLATSQPANLPMQQMQQLQQGQSVQQQHPQNNPQLQPVTQQTGQGQLHQPAPQQAVPRQSPQVQQTQPLPQQQQQNTMVTQQQPPTLLQQQPHQSQPQPQPQQQQQFQTQQLHNLFGFHHASAPGSTPLQTSMAQPTQLQTPQPTFASMADTPVTANPFLSNAPTPSSFDAFYAQFTQPSPYDPSLALNPTNSSGNTTSHGLPTNNASGNNANPTSVMTNQADLAFWREMPIGCADPGDWNIFTDRYVSFCKDALVQDRLGLCAFADLAVDQTYFSSSSYAQQLMTAIPHLGYNDSHHVE